MQWLDYVLLILVSAFFGYIWWQIEGNLNYKWRWHLIPNYILRYHTVREEWFANVILQGLAATVRISIYASVLAVILGIILGVARCSANLTVRMLARTYLEVLRNIPPLVVIFIFFFFHTTLPNSLGCLLQHPSTYSILHSSVSFLLHHVLCHSRVCRVGCYEVLYLHALLYPDQLHR